MKNIVKKVIVLVLVFSFVLGGLMIVYADNNYSCTLTVTQDKTTIAPEGKVTFELKVSNLQIGNEGLMVFQTIVEDNTEDITNNFTCKAFGDDAGVWSMTANFDGIITYIKQDSDEPINGECIIGKVTLEANKNIQPGKYTIKFTQNTFNTTDSEEIKIADITKTIEVKASTGNDSQQGGNSQSGTDTQQGGNSQSGTDSQQGGNSQSGTDSQQGGSSQSGSDYKIGDDSSIGRSSSTGDSSSESSTTKKSTSSSNSKGSLPYAGDIGILGIILVLIGVSGIAIMSFVKYKRLNI